MTVRQPQHQIDALFTERWSPRAFSDEAIPQAVLMSVFEAAHWAPSAFNLQPWRFVFAHRHGEGWAALLGLLDPENQAWAHRAAALIFLLSHRLRRRSNGQIEPIYSHSFDAGAAWGSLALQAHGLGWAARAMVGFDHDRCYEALGVSPEEYRVEVAIAIGRQTDKSVLPEHYQARETPSAREPVSHLVFEGRFAP